MAEVVDVDANATRPASEAAIEAYLRADALSTAAARRRSVEASRAQLAQHLGAHPEEVVFARGGSHANATALWAGVWAATDSLPTLALSRAEHRATLETASAIAEAGRARLLWLEVDPLGRVSDAAWRDLARGPAPTLISTLRAHNETGVVQDLGPIERVAASCGAWLHVDAVQALGRLPLGWAHSELSMMTLAGHKIGSLGGIGALLVRRHTSLFAQLVRSSDGPLAGGFAYPEREGGASSGLCASFAAAVDGLSAHVERECALAAWRDQFERLLCDRLRMTTTPVEVIGQNVQRLPNTSLLRLHGVAAEALLMALDVEGFSASSGSACSAGAPEPSASLLAMGYAEQAAREVIRISLSWPATRNAASLSEDLARLAEAIVAIVSQGSVADC